MLVEIVHQIRRNWFRPCGFCERRTISAVAKAARLVLNLHHYDRVLRVIFSDVPH